MSDNHDLLNDNNMCSFEEHEAENVCFNKDAVSCRDNSCSTSDRFVRILDFRHFERFSGLNRVTEKRTKRQFLMG